jgi:integrase
MDQSKLTVSASAQAKNGRLYAVIWYQEQSTGRSKPVWSTLGLDEGAKQSLVNRRLRETVNAFEEELNANVVEPICNDADLPIYDYLVKWLKRVRNSLQLTTYIGYNKVIEGRIHRYFNCRKDLTVGTIRAKDIEEFYDFAFSEGVSASTVIHYHAILHKAFSYAFKDEAINANPFDRVERPKRDKFQGKSFTEEELVALLNVTRNDPIYPAIVLGGCLGLRRSEALGARWSRVNYEEKTILIDTKIVEDRAIGKHLVIPVEVMKNKSSKRTLTLPQPVMDMLTEWRGRVDMYRTMFRESYNREYDDYICVDQLGNLLQPSYVTNHFAMLLRKHGFRQIRFHDLRHTFASILINKNKPLIEVSNFLGHSDISTTANIYAHLDKASKQGCADTITEIFDRKEKKGT